MNGKGNCCKALSQQSLGTQKSLHNHNRVTDLHPSFEPGTYKAGALNNRPQRSVIFFCCMQRRVLQGTPLALWIDNVFACLWNSAVCSCCEHFAPSDFSVAPFLSQVTALQTLPTKETVLKVARHVISTN